jgi:hypothetical protein
MAEDSMVDSEGSIYQFKMSKNPVRKIKDRVLSYMERI